MSPETQLASCYGLCSLENSLAFLKSEDQIMAVREMANKFNLGVNLQGAFILYQSQGVSGTCPMIASVFPSKFENGKEIHRRWTGPVTTNSDQGLNKTTHLHYLTDAKPLPFLRPGYSFDSHHTVQRSMDLICSTNELCGLLPADTFRIKTRGGLVTSWFTERDLQWWFSEQEVYCTDDEINLDLLYLQDIAPRQSVLSWKLSAKQHNFMGQEYIQAFRTDDIIVYQPRNLYTGKKVTLPVEYLTHSISSGDLDNHLHSYFKISSLTESKVISSRERVKEMTRDSRQIGAQIHGLFALYKASLIYSHLPNADIDLSVATRPLKDAHWAEINGRAMVSVLRSEAFACITMFDTGHINLKPSIFTDVMAVSSGDTLYVSEILLNDPCQPSVEHCVRCLIGNIGRPGVALLMAPQEPDLPEPSLNNWDIVNHLPFDGKIENNFQGTSLQLSLTGYEQNINIPATQGSRYHENAYIEAVVSAYDRGKWTGDLDILSIHRKNSFLSNYGNEAVSAFQKSSNFLMVELKPEKALPAACNHAADVKQSGDFETPAFSKTTSIDNWSEFLELPPNRAVIRANGNWIARLALAAAMRGRGDSALWASGHICWTCIEEAARKFQFAPEQLLILC